MKQLEKILLEEAVRDANKAKTANIITGQEGHPRQMDRTPRDHEPRYFHYHNMPEFCWCLSGTCIVQVDTRFYKMQAGDFCLVRRNTHHAESYVTASRNYELIWFIFHSVKDMLVAHCRYRNRHHRQLQSLHFDARESITRILDQLLENEGTTAGIRRQLKGLFADIGDHLANPPGRKDAYNFTDKRKSNYQVKRVVRAREFIREHYAEKISLDRIAGVVELNPEYFDRLFRQITRQTFISFLTHTRLEKAQIFMNETNLTLSEISYRVGFNDPYYFSRVFKKFFGLSPRKFRDKYTRL